MTEIDPEVQKTMEAVAGTFGGLLSFKRTEVIDQLDRMSAPVIAFFAGNRGGKTSSIANHYVKRVLGIHPDEKKESLGEEDPVHEFFASRGNGPGDAGQRPVHRTKKTNPL